MDAVKFLQALRFLGVIAMLFFLLFLAGSLVFLWLERRVIRNRYVWLDALSHYEWKRPSQIREDMAKLKGKKVWGSAVMYTDLHRLEEEGFIESRAKTVRLQGYRLRNREYKLTPSGTRRKATRKESDNKTSDSLQHV